MILLTKVRLQLTEEAQLRLDAFEDSLDEDGKIASVHTDHYGRSKEWYEEAGIKVPSEFFEKENVKNNYIDFEDSDYEDKLFQLYIIAKDIEAIEQEDDYTLVHMADKKAWVVLETAEEIFKLREKNVAQSK